MTDNDLEIITGLIDRIEALETKLADQDKIIQAWEKVHLPTPEEAVARIKARQATGQSPNYSHEESYILIWGAEKFERVWKKSAKPYLDSLDLKTGGPDDASGL